MGGIYTEGQSRSHTIPYVEVRLGGARMGGD